MTGALPAALRRPLTRRWPALARALGGAVLGLAVAEVVTTPGPDWRPFAAAGVVALVALAAPTTAQLAVWGGPPWLAWAGAIGLYVGVPETDHVVGLAVGLTPLVIAEALDRSRSSATIVVALGTALTWAVFQGAGDRPAVIAAAFGAFGLLLVSPLVAALPAPRRALVPTAVRGAVVAVAQAVVVIAVGRRGAVVASTSDAALAAALGLGALVVITRLAHGPVVGGRS